MVSATWSSKRIAWHSLGVVVCLLIIGAVVCSWTRCKNTSVVFRERHFDQSRGRALAEVTNGNFELSISNQSYEIPEAELVVELVPVGASGETSEVLRLARRVMPVKEQHHWVSLRYNLPAGKYDVLVHELKSRTTGQTSVRFPQSGNNLIVQFWCSAENAASPWPHLSIEMSASNSWSIL